LFNGIYPGERYAKAIVMTSHNYIALNLRFIWIRDQERTIYLETRNFMNNRFFLIRPTASLAFFLAMLTISALAGTANAAAADKSDASPKINVKQAGLISESNSKIFSELSDTALVAMKKRAEEIKIQGVGVIAYIEGDNVTTWTSKMIVVGKLKNAPNQKDRGANLLAIAYTKATEMADTLKDSGTSGRPPMTGETGWQGGLIKKVKTGYVIASFSGGPSEDDLKVAKVGLDILAEKF